MTILLDRIDAAPFQGNENITYELERWYITLVDTINSVLETVEPLLLKPVEISGTTQDAEVNTSYITNNGALTTITLPNKAPIFSRIKVSGQGAGGWVIAVGSGQTIKLAASSASTSVGSAGRYDVVEIQCIVADTTWSVSSYTSTGLILT